MKSSNPIVKAENPVEKKKEKHSKQMEVDEDDDVDTSEETPIMKDTKKVDMEEDSDIDTVEGLENKRQEMRKEMGKETVKKIRPNQQLYEAIKDRYQELLKELWKSQSKLEEFGFNTDEKKILNDRVKLWLEYFISTAAFRDDDVNLFEYMDTFCETQKFI